MTLPTPEQERQAVLALIAFTVLAILGTASAIAAIGIGLIKLAQWIWGFV